MLVAIAMQNANAEGTCVFTGHSCQENCKVKDFCDFTLKLTRATYTSYNMSLSKECETEWPVPSDRKTYPTLDECNDAGRQTRKEPCTYFPTMAAKMDWCQIGHRTSHTRMLTVLAWSNLLC